MMASLKIEASGAGLSEQALAASVFHHTRDGIMITGTNGKILAVNRAFTSITGYAAAEVIGRSPRILKSGRQNTEFYVGMWRDISLKGYWEGDLWNRHKDGSHFAERITIIAVPGTTDSPHHYIAIFSDVTKERERQRTLEERSTHDNLTGLPNRLLLQKRLDSAIAQASETGRPVGVIFIDLDGFKAVNDEFGHGTGDQQLCLIASKLASSLRASDTLSRFGGDEFVAVLPDLPDGPPLDAMLERILTACRRTVGEQPLVCRLSASVGLSLYPRDGSTADRLVQSADVAMYHAKRAGGDCYHFFDGSDDHSAAAQTAFERRLKKDSGH